MDANLCSQKIQKFNKKDLEKRFKEIVDFLDSRIKENKPLLPVSEEEKVEVYELDFPKVKTFHFDISGALLKEARILSKEIELAGNVKDVHFYAT